MSKSGLPPQKGWSLKRVKKIKLHKDLAESLTDVSIVALLHFWYWLGVSSFHLVVTINSLFWAKYLVTVHFEFFPQPPNILKWAGPAHFLYASFLVSISFSFWVLNVNSSLSQNGEVNYKKDTAVFSAPKYSTASTQTPPEFALSEEDPQPGMWI